MGGLLKGQREDTVKAILCLCVLFTATILFPRPIPADMGQVHVEDVAVSETSQKAIILHNGTEEILILGTDLKAESPVGILRFIPFPSEPQVRLAPADTFEKVTALLQQNALKFLQASKGGPPEQNAVELRLHKKLGAHDLTVIKVNDPLQFRAWANDYFKQKGLPTPATYATAEAIVEDYVKRGIPYFVFDFVDLGRETHSVDPVLYRFAGKDVYYPLKTSNTFGGQGSIDLILFTPGTLCEPSLGAYDTCLGFTHYGDHWQASTSAAVSPEELSTILPDPQAFFGDRQVFMQAVSYRGDYSFDRDILADSGKAIPHAIGHAEEQPGSPWILPMADVLAKTAAKEFADPSATERCKLRTDPGPCKGLFEKFYYDAEKNRCAVFFYGGCQGVVPFDTLEECEDLCLNSGTEEE